MPGNAVKILLVEDDLAEARLLHEVLKSFGLNQFNLVHVKRLGEALQQLQQSCFDVILLDLTLPDSQGLDSLKSIIQQAPNLPVVVLTNTNDDQLAIAAVRQGAQDYLVKRSINVEGLVRSLQYAIERKRVAEVLREENEVLEHQIREQTAQLIKAQKINQFKSDFVAMFSHDFRNPLTTIIASAGLLQQNKYELPEEKKLMLLQHILSAGKNLAQLLEEALFIGKSDSEQLPYQPKNLNLELFCRNLLEKLQLNLEQQNQIIFTIDGNFQDTIWDENLLQHILGNLLTNALKYSPKHSMVKFEVIKQGEIALFRIEDQGIGIPADELKHLSTFFYRGSNVRRIPGTGLGLAIVKRCVEVQKGTIEFQSEEGIGTVVTVTLPIIKHN
ncbi:response regulator receiver sensor signal transduction histidine kinase [Stanieria cyanosphaera PCC 7437]|uniref:histidine kinase n=1 Tax=Stanieria cyanosphaera (strain ATCC 29371 / PCC 7437) TaxID=111780 RepID=K9XYJ1_STAC7|nr:hybrid sensor histidine kinase/response regulator [Stanieria cyanosphaera]AFZ37670.1 response regulator receiver sensor signal transduction histidine kinase [Stanieria cyanosphaera PCC 7437]